MENLQDVTKKNRKWLKESLKPINGDKIGPYIMHVYNDYVEFVAKGECVPKIFTVAHGKFIELVSNFIASHQTQKVQSFVEIT